MAWYTGAVKYQARVTYTQHGEIRSKRVVLEPEPQWLDMAFSAAMAKLQDEAAEVFAWTWRDPADAPTPLKIIISIDWGRDA